MPITEPTNRSLKYLYFTTDRYRDFKALKKNIFEDETVRYYFWSALDGTRFYVRDKDMEEFMNNLMQFPYYTIILKYSTRGSAPRLSSISQADVDTLIERIRAWGRQIGLRWSNVEDDKIIFKLESGPYFNTARTGNNSSSGTTSGTTTTSSGSGFMPPP